MYSELNTVWEAWIRIRTNDASEAVTSKTQKKDLSAYTVDGGVVPSVLPY